MRVMSMGVQGAEAQSQPDIDSTVDDSGWNQIGEPQAYVEEPAWYVDETAAEDGSRKWLAALLSCAALLWAAAVAYWAYTRLLSGFSLDMVVQIIAVASAPLILLALAWILFGRTPRRESERFVNAVTAMRNQSAELESLLGLVATRLEDNHARMTGETEKLMRLGDEASDRLGRVTHFLSRETASLDDRSRALEAAAEAARIDIGVLLADLPRAEEQARTLADTLKQTGLGAHEQAGALEAQVAALAARGREADEVSSAAAQRLAAHLARIESNTAAASSRLEDAANTLTAASDAAVTRMTEGLDSTRAGIDSHSAALFAAIEQSRAAFDHAGAGASQRFNQEADQIGIRLGTLASFFGEQEQRSRALLESLRTEADSLNARFAALGDAGDLNAQRMGEGIAGVRAAIDSLQETLTQSGQSAATLRERSDGIASSLSNVAGLLSGDVSAGLAKVEDYATRANEAARFAGPEVAGLHQHAEAATKLLLDTQSNIAVQREALDSMLALINENIAQSEIRLAAMAIAVGEADEAASRLAGTTGADLVEAMARVRETAAQAAERAREAIEQVVPQSAATLAEATRRAVTEAIGGEVIAQMGEIDSQAERAVEAARNASERLTRQMLTLGETAGALELRIDEAKRAEDERNRENFSRRVSLLIESLNSTAIDVTKILSNEVTDGAWAAYLKGDRGVFTRRAVRLLDAAEAREILQHYDAEPDFRDQVNRYIHDFEAMLRRVLADRDGSALGVTLLSSDMGKLYVALAQAIERLRN